LGGGFGAYVVAAYGGGGEVEAGGLEDFAGEDFGVGYWFGLIRSSIFNICVSIGIVGIGWIFGGEGGLTDGDGTTFIKPILGTIVVFLVLVGFLLFLFVAGG